MLFSAFLSVVYTKQRVNWFFRSVFRNLGQRPREIRICPPIIGCMVDIEASRSTLIGLAAPSCARCGGSAVSNGRVCRCVDRAVFRACLDRFRACATGSVYAQPVWERVGTGPKGYRCYGRKAEEYMADFCLVARRALDPLEYAVFRFHFLLGADWKLCTARLNLDRGNFFHAVYRVEEKMGRVYRTLEPHPLFPLADYFRGTIRGARVTALPVDESEHQQPVRAPVVR
jgi:hypothetical protein